MEIKQLIELKKRELEELRKKRYEIEKELETKVKEYEALEKIKKIIEENPGIGEYISVNIPILQRGEVDGDNSKVKMG